MIMQWLRENIIAAGMLLLLRLYLGYDWMIHGYEKLTAAQPFDAGGFLKSAVANPIKDRATNELIYPTYTAFLQSFALPNAELFSAMIPWGEFLVGVGLLLGCLTTAAMFFGLLMNFMFMFAGTVSTNPWMILLGSIILVAGANAGRFGLDYYILPFFRRKLYSRNEPNPNKSTA
jgi:thiosulfate dehydrogenase (quinone) large subunit